MRHSISRDVYQSVARYFRPKRKYRTRREYLAERYLLCCFRTVESSSLEGLSEKVHPESQSDIQHNRNQAHLEEQFHNYYNTQDNRQLSEIRGKEK